MPDTPRRFLRVLLFWGVLTVVVSTLFSQGQDLPGMRYALVVGINKYEHGDLEELKAAENDARVLAKQLETLGYQVVRLLGKEATKAAIEKRMGEVCDRARQGDQVLISLSGHGLQFVQTDVAYFCPSDGRPFRERAETLVSMATVYSKLKTSFAGDRLLLLDACRTDPNARGRSGIDAESAPVPFGVAALYASAPGQKAQEDVNLGHGVFTYAVLQGLRGAASDPESGEVDFAGLGRYVQKHTPLLAAKLPGSPQQTPTLEARYKRNPVLVPRSTAAGDAPALKAPFGDREIATARAAWAKKLGVPEKKTLDLGGGVKMDLVLIPPGVFMLGSPETEPEREPFEKNEKQHEVELTQAFYMAVTETTQAQYKAITGENPSWFRGDALPTEAVSWNDAVAFCEKLSKKVGAKVSLPSEAQWEYACRAGTTTVFHLGDVLNGDKANLAGNEPYGTEVKGPSQGKTTPAGDVRYPANGFGLRDLHGNVEEWCQDGYLKDYEKLPRKDPLAGRQKEDLRVLRGGSWGSEARYCRAAIRGGATPGYTSNLLGFRVVVLP